MEVAVLLHEGVAATEALGPCAVLRRVPGTRIRFVAVEPGRFLAHEPPVELTATDWLGAVTAPDVVVIPGGFGAHELMDEPNLLEWVRQVHATSQWTTAISTGTMLLAAAGVLDGVAVTTHWLAADEITALGARPVAERVVRDGKVVTAMGGLGAYELALVVAEGVAGARTADDIRASIGLDPEAFDPKNTAKRAQLVDRWRRELDVTTSAKPTRWNRLVDRVRHGSVEIVPDDAPPRRDPAPAQLPKGWRKAPSSDASALDE